MNVFDFKSQIFNSLSLIESTISQLASLFDKIKEDIPIFFDKATTKLENCEFVIDDESSLT